jgi:hypothetical protein
VTPHMYYSEHLKIDADKFLQRFCGSVSLNLRVLTNWSLHEVASTFFSHGDTPKRKYSKRPPAHGKIRRAAACLAVVSPGNEGGLASTGAKDRRGAHTESISDRRGVDLDLLSYRTQGFWKKTLALTLGVVAKVSALFCAHATVNRPLGSGGKCRRRGVDPLSTGRR